MPRKREKSPLREYRLASWRWRRPHHSWQSRERGPREYNAERGSAILEGLVALSISFLLLALLTQLAFGLMTRNQVKAATDAAARDLAALDASQAEAHSELIQFIAEAVPGSSNPSVQIGGDSEQVTVEVDFDWDAPGPRWTTVHFSVRSAAPRTVAP